MDQEARGWSPGGILRALWSLGLQEALGDQGALAVHRSPHQGVQADPEVRGVPLQTLPLDQVVQDSQELRVVPAGCSLGRKNLHLAPPSLPSVQDLQAPP